MWNSVHIYFLNSVYKSLLSYYVNFIHKGPVGSPQFVNMFALVLSTQSHYFKYLALDNFQIYIYNMDFM